MKVNVYIRMSMVGLELPDHLDPKLHARTHWRTRWGHFGAAGQPQQLPPFVDAAKQAAADMLARHGLEALSGSVEIVPELAPAE